MYWLVGWLAFNGTLSTQDVPGTHTLPTCHTSLNVSWASIQLKLTTSVTLLTTHVL